MGRKLSRVLYGIYQFILAFGAIRNGYYMVRDSSRLYGVYSEYPPEWLNKFPWDSWLIPGLIAIVFFGIGNIIAAFSSFTLRQKKAAIPGIVMGSILIISIVIQMLYLDVYLVSGFFFILGIIQLSYGLYVYKLNTKVILSISIILVFTLTFFR